MPGSPTDLFELEIAPLWADLPQGVPGASIMNGLKTLMEPARWELLSTQTVVPLGLRWRVAPELGLPRGVFSLFRRDRRIELPTNFAFTPAQVATFHNGAGAFRLPIQPAYQMLIGIKNTDPGATLVVKALDHLDRELQLQEVSILPGTGRVVRFQHPFLRGFKVTGTTSFEVLQVKGITMKGVSDLASDWKLIEKVGLPALAGEIDGYDEELQGFPTQLVKAPDASSNRNSIAQLFYRQLPSVLPNGVNVPVWEIPSPVEAVGELRDGSPSLIKRIDEMLRAVDSGVVQKQKDFRADIEVPGLHQGATPGQATPNATISVPLLASVLLNASTDPWFALASGFGSTDFPEFLPPTDRFIEPSTYFNCTHDYMVVATFRIRLFGFELKLEHFALSHRSAAPAIPSDGLVASEFALNRPPHRDEPWSIEAALAWPKTNKIQIQGNAVAVAEDGPNGAYLNALRPAVPPDKPALFVPMKPGETSDPMLATHNRFIHHETDLPFAGARTNRYGVATMDAYGRWSEWRTTDLTLQARQPESPRLSGLTLTPDMAGLSGITVPHRLTFEIVWDWQDRSPKRLEVAAVFHKRTFFPDGTKDDGHIPPTDYPSIFQSNNAIQTGAFVEISFASDTPPGTAPAFDSTPASTDPRVSVELLPESVSSTGQNVDGEMRRYRVTVDDLMVSFQPNEAWYYTLFVKASEWRNPAQLSDTVPPLLPGRPPHLTASVPNPIPPLPPVFTPADILWSALPDAMGTSRLRLAFDRVESATGGYAVFMAFEAKLRDIADLDPRSDADMIGRATDLRDIAMPLEASKDAFSRLNAKLLPQPPPGQLVDYEIELAGTLDGLVAVSVCAVSREQIMSPLAVPWLFVGVPRMSVPLPPALTLKQSNGTAAITCEFAKTPSPDRIEIFRCANEFAAGDIGKMGPAIHESPASEWIALDESGAIVTDLGQASKFRFQMSDDLTPRWTPYLYRAVSVGITDDTNGFRAGRSVKSNLVMAESLPKTPPPIEELATEQGGPGVAVIRFKSDAPVARIERGSFQVQVYVWDESIPGFAATPVIDRFLPNSRPLPTTMVPGEIYHSQSDADGKRTFHMPATMVASKYMFKVRFTDPLGRSTEAVTSGELTVSNAPDLSNLQSRRQLRNLLIAFETTTSVTPPPFGEYKLEITFFPLAGGIQLLFRTALHNIPAADLATLAASPVSTIIRDSSSGHPFRFGAMVRNFYPFFPPTRPGRLRVRLTAPDGTETKIERDI